MATKYFCDSCGVDGDIDDAVPENVRLICHGLFDEEYLLCMRCRDMVEDAIIEAIKMGSAQ